MADLIHLTLLRHGRSRADDEGVLEGRYDSPLTELGLAQARARAADWQQSGPQSWVQFDRIICSTLQRARASAEIIAEYLHVPLECDPDWMELDNGALAGMPKAEAAQRYPLPAFRSPYQPIGDSGESEIELHARAARAVERIIRRGPGHTLVIAHSGILNAALREILGVPHPVNFSGAWFNFT